MSDWIDGKALSLAMALRIEKAFGVSMDTLLRMHSWHDAYAMRQRAAEINVERHQLEFACRFNRAKQGMTAR